MMISAGNDGFLQLWNLNGSSQFFSGEPVQRFQISPYSITTMAHRPGTEEVCVIENDGLGMYRISAWNYRRCENIFTLQFRDPIGYITYSAEGSFIIAARTGRTALVFIDANSGDVLHSPPSLTGTVSYAVTGRSERTMMAYFASGAISYWNLDSGSETNRFSAPPNLLSPVMFGNNRYLAGVNAQGLAVVDAVSGAVVARDSTVPHNAMLCPAGEDFICVIREKESAQMRIYSIDRAHNLAMQLDENIFEHIQPSDITAVAANGTIALGAADGSMFIAGRNGQPRPLAAKNHLRITDAAAAGGGRSPTIAFLADGGILGIIPLDYGRLAAGSSISVEKIEEAWNRVTAFNANGGSSDQVILWHDRNSRMLPAIRQVAGNGASAKLNITLRSPIRTAASYGGRALFLDATGNLSVISPDAAARPFTFFSMGLLDAAFIDSERIILGRSAVAGNSPFLSLNIATGETVPLPYDAQAGVTVYRGDSGCIYAAAVSEQPEGIATSIIQLELDAAKSAQSQRVADFPDEDTQFSLIEMPGGNTGRLAATLGGGSIAIYTAARVQELDRTAGLPLRLINGGTSLISIDRDGSIAWYDSISGRLLAVFRLHPDEWTLQTEKATISGRLNRTEAD